MDQMKIGTFIAERRKAQNLTQMQLAEKLGITDRAVSKWERGKSLPDASVMLELCSILKITVNDLLCGEVTMENTNERMEKTLIEMVRQKEQSDRRLLKMEIVIGVVSLLFMLSMIAVGIAFAKLGYPTWIFFVLFGVGLVQFLVAMSFAVRIEQVAGYYECQKCGHRYVPKYGSVYMAMHVNRTRYMKCPDCGKWSWQKKVMKKEG